MADVKTAPVFNALYGINVTVRMNLRGHFDIIYGTNKHRITGKGGAFGNLNAGGFQKNFRLDITYDIQPKILLETSSIEVSRRILGWIS